MKKQLFAARLNYIESLLLDLKQANLSALRVSLRPGNEWNYLHSYAQVARFLQCDPKTAASLLNERLIRYTMIGGEISVFIPDILEAAAKHERIGKFIARIRSGQTASAPDSGSCHSSSIRAILPPKIMVETELYPDRFVFATIKYQGWKCDACIPYHLWNQPDKVIDFVQQIILNRHEKYPFRIPPVI